MALTAHQFQIELGASLAGNFTSSLDKGKQQIGALGRAVKDLDLQFRQATAVTKLRDETAQAEQAWKDAENQLRSLSLEMKQAESPSAELSQRFEEAKLSAQQAKHAFLEKQGSLEQLSATLRENGVDVDALAAKQAAQAAYEKLIQKRHTFSATVIGHLWMAAEARLALRGFQTELPSRWKISRATHSLTNTGYTTSLEAMLDEEFSEPFKDSE